MNARCVRVKVAREAHAKSRRAAVLTKRQRRETGGERRVKGESGGAAWARAVHLSGSYRYAERRACVCMHACERQTCSPSPAAHHKVAFLRFHLALPHSQWYLPRLDGEYAEMEASDAMRSSLARGDTPSTRQRGWRGQRRNRLAWLRRWVAGVETVRGGEQKEIRCCTRATVALDRQRATQGVAPLYVLFPSSLL